MKIIIINRSTEPVATPAATSVAAGASLELTERTVGEYQRMVSQDAGEYVSIVGELEDADYPPLVCTQKTPADPAGGVDTLAGVGFDINDLVGSAADIDPQMYVGVFADAACLTPSTTADLDTATEGTIDEGAGTNLLKVTPDSAGGFTCSVDDTADETVYIKAWAVASQRPMDTSDQHAVTFSA